MLFSTVSSAQVFLKNKLGAWGNIVHTLYIFTPNNAPVEVEDVIINLGTSIAGKCHFSRAIFVKEMTGEEKGIIESGIHGIVAEDAFAILGNGAYDCMKDDVLYHGNRFSTGDIQFELDASRTVVGSTPSTSHIDIR